MKRSLLLLPLALTLAGCSSTDGASATPRGGAFVGGLAATDARVGLVVDSDSGVLYVCGGPTTRAELTRWFRGPRTGSGIDWMTDDLRVVAAPSGAEWAGEVRAKDGRTFPFRLTATSAGTLAGLYDANLPEGRAGVVVFQTSPSDAPTMQGTFRSKSNVFDQVLPVREISLSARGLEVRVPSLTDSFFVQPVAP